MTDAPYSPHIDPEDNCRRIIDLEERLTFQQQVLDQLNIVVRDQQHEMDRLKSELTRYRNELEQLSERVAGDDLPPEKPPHY